jgi:lipopolysaccharide/colanic/teichoic acid biosynthesis glycosyltransferase
MVNSKINLQLFRRYTAAQSLPGRWWLNVLVRCRQCFWLCLMTGGRCVKRGLDIAASATFVLVFSPLFLLIAALIKMDDGGPVLFAQTRVGKNGRQFKMFKFRSMCPDAERRLQELMARNHHKEGVTFKINDDPRLTHVGGWLRAFSLDELPQFFNVLKGDMTLVGPRPPLPREVALYSLADRRRLLVKPGITCFWQIGGRSEIDFSGQVKLDVRYIETQSFWVDIVILFKTVPAVLSRKGAC